MVLDRGDWRHRLKPWGKPESINRVSARLSNSDETGNVDELHNLICNNNIN